MDTMKTTLDLLRLLGCAPGTMGPCTDTGKVKSTRPPFFKYNRSGFHRKKKNLQEALDEAHRQEYPLSMLKEWQPGLPQKTDFFPSPDPWDSPRPAGSAIPVRVTY